MNKRIIIGVIISVTVLFLTPLLPTVQFTKAYEANKQAISEDIDHMIVNSLFQEIDHSGDIENKFLTTIISSLSEGSFIQRYVSSFDTDDGDDPQPLCFPFLGIFIYGLIAFVIFKIIAYVFHYFGSIIKTITNKITTSIKNFILKIVNLIRFILKLVSTIVQGIITLLLKTGEFIITVIATIVSAILAVILFILNVIVAILQRIWQGFGAFLGLMMEIFMLIYETIFPSMNATV